MGDSITLLTAIRAEALFTSDLSTESDPSCAEVAAAIRGALRTHGGALGCAIELAGAYGDRPETAAPRMRWALRVVEATYPVSAGRFTPGRLVDNTSEAWVSEPCEQPASNPASTFVRRAKRTIRFTTSRTNRQGFVAGGAAAQR
jgi:hypothetical protein